tara:strand:+ start:549 stop:1094 length:546 start_codon:yes stop_codon:yes gene_type:complete
MMLTRKQLQMIEILTWKKAHRATNDGTAAHFGIGVMMVMNAEKWAQRTGYFIVDTADVLEKHMAAIRKAIGEIEKELRIARQHSRIKITKGDGRTTTRRIPLPATTFNAIFGRWLEYNTRLMEIEGLYRKVLNVNINTSVEHSEHRADLEKLDISELKTLRALTAKARNGHGSNGGQHGDN